MTSSDIIYIISSMLFGLFCPRLAFLSIIVICVCFPQFYFHEDMSHALRRNFLISKLPYDLTLGFCCSLIVYSVLSVHKKFIVVILPFTVWLIIAIMVGISNGYKFKYIFMDGISYVGYIMLPATFIMITKDKIDRTFYLNLLLVCFSVAAILSIFEFIEGMGISSRGIWVGGNSAKGQIYSLFGVVVLLFYYMKQKNNILKNLGYIVMLCLFFVAVLININKTILICLFVTVALLILKSDVKMSAIYILILVLSISLSIFVATEQKWFDMAFFFSDRLTYLGDDLRIYEYNLATNIFGSLNSAIAGFGLGSSWFFDQINYGFHSIIAYLLYKSGVFGLTLWLVGLLIFIKEANLYKLATCYISKKNMAIVVILINCLVMSIFQNKFSTILFTPVIGSFAGYLLASFDYDY